MPQPEINTSLYPKNLRMAHGNDDEREWWQWKRQGKAIAIQCLPCRKHPWQVYFIDGADIRPLGVGGPGDSGLQSCIEGLKGLGFSVKLGQKGVSIGEPNMDEEAGRLAH
jgi:hypothetical protein